VSCGRKYFEKENKLVHQKKKKLVESFSYLFIHKSQNIYDLFRRGTFNALIARR